MRPFVRRVGGAVMRAQAGGFLATPPGFEGESGLGIPGFSGAPRAREWDAVESTEAPALRGDEVHFVALADSDLTIVVDEDEPDGSVTPLADAVEKLIDPPYRAAGERQGPTVWTVGAMRVEVVELPPDVAGDAIELASVAGNRELRIDGEVSSRELPALAACAARFDGDYALVAERLTDTTWVVDATAL